MWNEPALWVVIVAILWSFVSRLLPSPSPEVIVLPSIFVGLVSFCDSNWPSMVRQMIDTAYARDTLRIGVVEYVRSVADSQEPYLPPEWRLIVTVYTVSHRTARTQRTARKLCADELYRNESYVMFVRGAEMHMHWDRELMKCMSPPSSIVSTRVDRKGAITFPCIADGVLRYRNPVEVHETAEALMPSLITQTELIFFSSKALDLILSTSDDVELSAALVENGFSLFAPAFSIATRSRVPVGVNRGKLRPRTKVGKAYADRNGFGTTATANARLGLTPEAGSVEIIAKYGSIVGARLAIQEEEAVMQMGLQASPPA
tara:strand:+ start:1941 stop:2891 length:951 start_codon:yes stop_codon:yes gene_type:complete